MKTKKVDYYCGEVEKLIRDNFDYLITPYKDLDIEKFNEVDFMDKVFFDKMRFLGDGERCLFNHSLYGGDKSEWINDNPTTFDVIVSCIDEFYGRMWCFEDFMDLEILGGDETLLPLYEEIYECENRLLEMESIRFEKLFEIVKMS